MSFSLLLFPVILAAQQIPLGKWTGKVIASTGEEIPITFDIAIKRDSVSIVINSPGGPMPASAVTLRSDSLRFEFGSERRVNCALARRADGVYDGTCRDNAAAESGRIVMEPPKTAPVEARPETAAAPGVPVYVVKPPAGKLPIPFHDPSFTKVQYDSMMAALWIINNYGAYATGPTPATMYLHPGLDFLAPDGTRVFAMEAGRVVYARDMPDGAGVVVVQDADEPNKAWQYAHVENLAVKVGDQVPAGALLARVRFIGMAHTHVDRLHAATMPMDWTDVGLQNREYHYSMHFFDLQDKESPVFGSRALHFYRNESNEEFTPTSQGTTVVSGDVDIVAALRDRAPYSRQKNIGDMLALTRLEYEIRRPDGTTVVRPSWDLSKVFLTIKSPRDPQKAAEAQTVLKHVPLRERKPGEPWKPMEPYYILTNVPQGGVNGRIDAAVLGPNAWKTGERDASGRPIWPDGSYSITVRAWDASGNLASVTGKVTVRN